MKCVITCVTVILQNIYIMSADLVVNFPTFYEAVFKNVLR